MGAIRKLGDKFIATEVDGEVLIVGLDGRELFSLTGTAKAVRDAINGERDGDAIGGKMAVDYKGEADAICRPTLPIASSASTTTGSRGTER